ncbi:MAG: integrase core domain-containing protein [Actinobacteria bacterium]|nr:integrase core domain-containing protein [Actinomycetota bacterium]MCA1738579.1 integrase core domain-containing protein [Actinomycetota bacterium]
MDTRLTLEALRRALERRRPPAGLIHHSDQGVQYASCEYVATLEEAGVQISMAAVGNPYENAKAESFFRTLKMEEVYLKYYRTFEEAEENIGGFIEEVYNKKRLHSSLGYMPPVEFETRHVLKAGS